MPTLQGPLTSHGSQLARDGAAEVSRFRPGVEPYLAFGGSEYSDCRASTDIAVE